MCLVPSFARTGMATLVAVVALTPFASAQSLAHQQALDLIQTEARTIAFVMHPTASFQDATFETPEVVRGDCFRIVGTFHFKSEPFKRSIRSTLTFYFDPDGQVDFVVAGSSTSMVAPFSASDRVLRWAKKRMQQDADVQSNPAVMRVLEKADSREVLEAVLRYSQASR